MRWEKTRPMPSGAGYFLRPLYGVSKIRATPSWSVYSAAISCLVFAGLYWLMDVQRVRRWAHFLRPAGENPLLVYILPGIVMCTLGLLNVTFLDDHLGAGMPRVFRALVMAAALVYVAKFLGKAGLRLKL
jgi:predicted acyltransferase